MSNTAADVPIGPLDSDNERPEQTTSKGGAFSEQRAQAQAVRRSVDASKRAAANESKKVIRGSGAPTKEPSGSGGKPVRQP